MKLKRHLEKIDKLRAFAQEYHNDFIAIIWIIKWAKWHMNKAFECLGGFYKAEFIFKNHE